MHISSVDSRYSLSWSPKSINGGSILTSHEIERKLASQDDTFYANVGSVGGAATSFTDTAGNGLILIESYDYRVFATNAIGTSLSSNVAQATTAGGALPANPLITVDSIVLSGNGGQNADKHITGVVTVLEVVGSAPVAGATVTVEITNGSDTTSCTDVTLADGTMQCTVKNAASGTWTGVIITVVPPTGFDWDGLPASIVVDFFKA